MAVGELRDACRRQTARYQQDTDCNILADEEENGASDPILQALSQWRKNVPEDDGSDDIDNDTLRHAAALRRIAQVEAELQQAQIAHQLHSDRVALRTTELRAVQDQRDQLAEIVEIQQAQQIRNLQTELVENNNNLGSESMEAVKSASATTPSNTTARRLRQQLALYAACTGIKWDFQNDDEKSSHGMLLSGTVDVPSRAVMVPFSIDTVEHSRMKICQALWNTMAGKTME